MSDLEQLYDAVEAVTSELASNQPWWPCFSCPVAKTLENCCHKAMFHVSATEWEYLREHPFIQEHRDELVQSARKTLKTLKHQGWDVENWTSTIEHFSQGGCFTCPLLNAETGLCNVYDRRPLICRTYGVSHPTQDGAVFGCPIVVDAVADHATPDKPINFVILPQVNQYASEHVLYKPTKPIVAWLAEEQL